MLVNCVYAGSIDSQVTVNWLGGAGVGWESQWEQYCQVVL